MPGRWDGLRLAGVYEAAQVLGVSDRRARDLLATDAAPAPLAVLKAGAIYDMDEVEAYAKARSRAPGRPRKNS